MIGISSDNTILVVIYVQYDLAGPVLYDINLGATTMTSLSTRGVTIPINLVTSTTGLFTVYHSSIKPVPVAYSDLKSEFLCQSSKHCPWTYRPPEPPCTPGISPTPSQPCIIHITQNQVLLPSTSKRSFASNVPYILVAATLLKSSRMFSPNVTLTQTSLWLPLPSDTRTDGENATSPKDILKKQIGAKTEPLGLDTILPTQMTQQSWFQLTSTSNACSGDVPT